MTETTTIEITDEQKAQLDSLKRTDTESYKSVLQRLIDHYGKSESPITEAEAREIATEEIESRVTPRALER